MIGWRPGRCQCGWSIRRPRRSQFIAAALKPIDMAAKTCWTMSPLCRASSCRWRICSARDNRLFAHQSSRDSRDDGLKPQSDHRYADGHGQGAVHLKRLSCFDLRQRGKDYPHPYGNECNPDEYPNAHLRLPIENEIDRSFKWRDG